MADLVLTGASRGIGHALALALANRGDRLLLVARDRARLDALAAEIARRGGEAFPVPGDLGTLAGAAALGEQLAGLVGEGATLVHNAGLWPTSRVLTPEGHESAFVVNHLAPLVLQRPLLAAKRLRRILVVSAGLIALGRFDPRKTPRGEDFSRLRTYCTTKLCFALAMRDVAADHPEIDVLVLHPGVVRTDLGALPGWLGKALSLVKRRFEAPEVCAERLARILGRERWSSPAEARWMFDEQEKPWPGAAASAGARRAVREATAEILAGG